MMQVATVKNSQPWICTLYYVSDTDNNLYWISKPDTRHSKEIENHPKVAVAIPVKFESLSVVGLQIEGNAQVVKNTSEIKRIARLYTDKFSRGEDWYKNFIAGKNEHKLYRIKPKLFVLFDPENFPDKERQEIKA